MPRFVGTAITAYLRFIGPLFAGALGGGGCGFVSGYENLELSALADGDAQIAEVTDAEVAMVIDGADTKTAPAHRIDVDPPTSADARVVSDPPGLDCGSTCSASFPIGTKVRLTIKPGRSIFKGWTGACSGAERTCEVTQSETPLRIGVFVDVNEYNLAFVTSTEHDGGLGGATRADEICAARAREAGLDGTYRALLATSQPAYQRLTGAQGWVRVDGAPVLTDRTRPETIVTPLDLDELGRRVETTVSAWTGVGHTAENCELWTTASPTARGKVGKPEAGQREWIEGPLAGASCDQPARLYCFGIDRSRPLVFTKSTGRIVFVSKPLGLVGPAEFDRACNEDAAAAALPGTYAAMVVTSTASAVERVGIAPDDTTFVRPDGQVLGEGHEFFDGRLRAPIALTAAASPASGPTRFGPFTFANRENRCGDWVTASTGLFRLGSTSSTYKTFSNGNRECAATDSLPVFCVQRP
jgi:hypothetical protein